jgi:hypothetical protein
MKLFQGLIVGVLTAVFGIVVALAISLLTGTVGYWLWNFVGPEYFSFLPAKYLNIPWTHMVILTYFATFVGSLFRGSNSST